MTSNDRSRPSLPRAAKSKGAIDDDSKRASTTAATDTVTVTTAVSKRRRSTMTTSKQSDDNDGTKKVAKKKTASKNKKKTTATTNAGDEKKKKKRKRTSKARDDDDGDATPEFATYVPARAADDARASPLLDLGGLVRGRLVKRPSATVKSPYVADVVLDDGAAVLAHAPSLDVGGLCVPGSVVWLTDRRRRESGKKATGTTSHAIELVEADGDGDDDDDDAPVLVGCAPSLGERAAEEAVARGLLNDAVRRVYDVDGRVGLRRQRTRGDARVDLELVGPSSSSRGDARATLVEVKNVVCADFAPSRAPERRSPNHCVVLRKTETGADGPPLPRAGLFPWGLRRQTDEKGRRVVSARAVRHVRNLAETVTSSKDVDADVDAAVLLFVANRSDCARVRVDDEGCPAFAEETERFVATEGCDAVGMRVRWTVPDGKAWYDGTVPVSVTTTTETTPA